MTGISSVSGVSQICFDMWEGLSYWQSVWGTTRQVSSGAMSKQWSRANDGLGYKFHGYRVHPTKCKALMLCSPGGCQQSLICSFGSIQLDSGLGTLYTRNVTFDSKLSLVEAQFRTGVKRCLDKDLEHCGRLLIILETEKKAICLQLA